MQKNFELMRKQVEARQRCELPDVTAKVGHLPGVRRRQVGSSKTPSAKRDLYFEPKYREFRSRTIWSLSNVFTSAFKELDPIPQFKATTKLVLGGSILSAVLESRVLGLKAGTDTPFITLDGLHCAIVTCVLRC